MWKLGTLSVDYGIGWVAPRYSNMCSTACMHITLLWLIGGMHTASADVTLKFLLAYSIACPLWCL